MTLYLATINTPGYLPEAEPAYFDTAAEAWDHLWDEHTRACEDAERDVSIHASTSFSDVRHQGTTDALVLPTPGYDGDHDLGVTYTVTKVLGVMCQACGQIFGDAAELDAHGLDAHLEADHR